MSEKPLNEYETGEELAEALKVAKTQSRRLEILARLAHFEPEEARPLLIMYDPTCVDSQDAVTIELGSQQFNPLVAYPIFAADYIRGFEAPQLTLKYDPVTLLCDVEFTSKSKVNDEAQSPVEIIKPFLPSETIYGDLESWKSNSAKDRKEFQAIFDLKPEFDLGEYEVRKLSFKDPVQSKYLNRMSIFPLFFIEGAHKFDSKDTTWKYYVITSKKSNEFVGYVSEYTFFCYISAAKLESYEGNLTRKRISQFVVMPPYQRQHIGHKVYTSLWQSYISDPSVVELAVEDPTLEFEMLRDRAHYDTITKNKEAAELLESYPEKSAEVLDWLYDRYKLDKVHFQRLAEMFFVYNAEQSNSASERKIVTNLAKQRLYLKNHEAFKAMQPDDQREKLDKLSQSVIHGHKVVLRLAEPESDSEDEAPEMNPSDMLQALTGMEPAAKKRKQE